MNSNKTNESQDEPNIVFVMKSKRTSQNGTLNMKHWIWQHEQNEPH